MIKPEELRIGNYVTNEFYKEYKEFIRVEDLNEIGINLFVDDDSESYEIAEYFINVTHKYSELYGIPITEEILLKCGFVRCHDKEYKYSFNEDNCLILSPYKGKYIMCDIDISVVVKYLHQLQNLFYSLTQKELKIEL